MRAEYVVAVLLLLGGGVALALSLAGDDEPAREPAAATSAPSEAADTSPRTDTVARGDEKITVRVDGRRKTVRAGLIRTPFCAERLALCAAVAGKAGAPLTPAQRRVVRRAKAKLRRERAEQRRRKQEQTAPAPAPTPTPTPTPAPAPAPPAPEPAPQSEPGTTG